MKAYGNGFTVVAARRGVDLPDPAQRLRIPAPRLPHPRPTALLEASPVEADVVEAEVVDVEADVAVVTPGARTRRPALAAAPRSSTSSAHSSSRRSASRSPRPCEACGVVVTAAHIARTGRALHGCCQPSAAADAGDADAVDVTP